MRCGCRVTGSDGACGGAREVLSEHLDGGVALELRLNVEHAVDDLGGDRRELDVVGQAALVVLGLREDRVDLQPREAKIGRAQQVAQLVHAEHYALVLVGVGEELREVLFQLGRLLALLVTWRRANRQRGRARKAQRAWVGIAKVASLSAPRALPRVTAPVTRAGHTLPRGRTSVCPATTS